ncbi:MAG TPA: dUTP diphosphatase [Solirubrobacteraceae bacterium]|jgi:dUTP pyrophosphatase|nr:dUTP diphosphatase [Solirubrobacteraceae bacterium]
MTTRLEVQLLDDELGAPTRAHPGDAGLDLAARTSATLTAAMEPVAIPTGIAVAIPTGYVGLVCPRSGLALAQGITVLNAPGIVDTEYRGEIVVVLYRTLPAPYTVQRGDRIAQLLVVPVVADLDLVISASLPTSRRGQSGFGSTGR